MEILLLTIGATRTNWVKQGISEYTERLRRYIPFAIKEIPDPKKVKSMPEQAQKIAEGKSFLTLIDKSDFVILLDERGEQFTSVAFADKLQRFMVSGLKRIVFCIGGPYGFSDEIYARANAKISLSRMTFNHEMVRVFFIEQIYRASTILRGEPYHHE